MSKYHINEKGNPGLCRAQQTCPFGGANEHFATPEAAASAFEASQIALPIIHKKRPGSEEPVMQVYETVHGSNLYGLAHPNSDLDVYKIITGDPLQINRRRRKTSQVIAGNDDKLEIELSDFLQKAQTGVPQALEAMFSDLGSGDFNFYRRAYRLYTPAFANTYRRTILNFARDTMNDEKALALIPSATATELMKRGIPAASKKKRTLNEKDCLKYRRHSLRLLLNRDTGIALGRFNPTLNESQIDFVKTNAELSDEKIAKLLLERVY